jgi:PUA domain protein
VPEIKHRRFLREKEVEQILDEFTKKLGLDIQELLDTKKTGIEVADTPTGKIFFINGKPVIASLKNTLVPTLLFDKALVLLPKITVNMGAVPHICNGADLMAPGIARIEGDFKANDYVLVIDERNQKPLAVTVALVDSQGARKLQHGKVTKNLHYVGDDLWNQLKKA